MSLSVNFRATNIGPTSFSLQWQIPTNADAVYLDSFDILDAAGGTVVSGISPTAVSYTSATILGDAATVLTRYQYALRANFSTTIEDEDPYTGQGSEYTNVWTQETSLQTLWTLGAFSAPVPYASNTFPVWDTYLDGTLAISIDLVLTDALSMTLWHRVGSAGAWELKRFWWQPAVGTHEFVLEDLSPTHSNQFRSQIITAAGETVYSDVVTYVASLVRSDPFSHKPYVITIPQTFATSTSIFVGNIAPNTPWNPADGGVLPAGLEEWIKVGSALVDGESVFTYRRLATDKSSMHYTRNPMRDTDWTTQVTHTLYAQSQNFVNMNTDRWWDISSEPMSKVYTPNPAFQYNGDNNPFLFVTGTLPFASTWEWPTTLMPYTRVDDSPTDVTPDYAVAGVGEWITPYFTAINLNSAIYEVVGSAVENYVKQIPSISLIDVSYKLYIFVRYAYLLTDTYELVDNDGTTAMSLEASAISFLGKQGNLYSVTRAASATVNPETYGLTMDIIPKTFNITDGAEQTFGSFVWPNAPFNVSDVNNGSPFYTTANSIAHVAVADPYTSLSAQAMVVNFSMTNPYPMPVL